MTGSRGVVCAFGALLAIAAPMRADPPTTGPARIADDWLGFAETAADHAGGEMRVHVLADVAIFEARRGDPARYHAALARTRQAFDETKDVAARARAAVCLLGATFADASDADDDAAMVTLKVAIDADPSEQDRDDDIAAAARVIAAQGAVATALSYADAVPEKYFERATLQTDIALAMARGATPQRFVGAFDAAESRLNAIELTEPYELETIYAALALAAATAGDWTRAESAITAMSDGDFEAYSWTQLAGIAYQAPNRERGDGYLKQAESASGQLSAATHAAIAIVAASAGDRVHAERSLATARAAKPSDLNVRFATATVGYLLHDDAAADATLLEIEAALAKEPKHRDYDEDRARLATVLSSTGHRLVAMRVAAEIDATAPATLRSATFRTIGDDIARAGFPTAESKWIRLMLDPADAVAAALGAAAATTPTP